MRTRSPMTLALFAMVLGACDTRDADTEPGLLPTDDIRETQEVVVARADFEAMPDAEGLNVSGWAEFRQQGATWQDGVELYVHVMGLGEGPHAWHIHQGTCQQPGQVVVPLSDFGGRSGITSDLTPRGDGMIEETVSLDREHMAGVNLQGDHVIVVHLRGSDNPGPGIACANIDLTGGAMGGQPGMGTQQPGLQPGTGAQPGQPGTGAQPGTGTTGS